MNDLIEAMEQLSRSESILDILATLTQSGRKVLGSVDWLFGVKLCSVFLLVTCLVQLLLLANERIFDHYFHKRIKTHHLKITNNGNTPSVFLLRTVQMSDTLAIRFRTNGNPMIWVSRKDKTRSEAEKAAEPAPQEPASDGNAVQGSASAPQESGLIPNLNDPMHPLEAGKKAAGAGKKVVTDVGKKAGLLGSILGTISALLPGKVSGLQEAQSSLKGVQQQSNQIINTANTKADNADLLKGQVSSLVPAGVKDGFQKVSDAGKELKNEAIPEVQMPDAIPGGPDVVDALESRDFVYDEQLWHENIGKTDEDGGALNYAQSKILEPGETTEIDLEILNLSNNMMQISCLYKIEVLQIPQSNLHLMAPSQVVHGIVTFPKVKLTERIIPSIMVDIMILAGIQLVAGYSYLIF